MNSIRFTDRFIRATKPAKRVIEHSEAVQTGLTLRVWPSGKKSWAVRYWLDGKTVRSTLGQWPEMSLADARDLAAEARRAKRLGQDPREVIRPSRPVEEVHPTFRAAADRWLADQKAHGRRSADLQYRLLELHVFDRFDDKPTTEVTRADMADLLEELRDEKGLGSQVNRVHAVLSGIFTLALDSGLIDTHPMTRMRRRVKETERDTRLTLDQLATLWQAAGEVSSISGDIVRLLILLECRREEVARMRWSELDLDKAEWTLPAERTKAKRKRVVPLSGKVLQIIKDRPKGRGDFVFSATGGKTPFAGWRRAAELLRNKAKLPVGWTFHDIRRSVVTIMGDELHILEETIARILDHSQRARRGVTARYDRSQRLATVAEALAVWERLLLSVVHGQDNVVALPVGRPRGGSVRVLGIDTG